MKIVCFLLTILAIVFVGYLINGTIAVAGDNDWQDWQDWQDWRDWKDWKDWKD